MFFDRDENLKRQRQMAYRNQLKEQLQLKNSKILTKPQRSYNERQQTFSLLKNIEVEAQTRKNKQSNYYEELRNQIQFEKQQKKKKKQQEAKKQREEEEKIRKDNEVLRQRAQMEKMKEKKKNGQPSNDNSSFGNSNVITQENNNTKRINMQQSNPLPNYKENGGSNYRSSNQNTYNQNPNFQSRLKTSESQRGEGQLPMQSIQAQSQRKGPFSMSQLPIYMNRVQNETFNFLPQRKYMDSYFQELLGERRRFQQEASSISQLNKLLYQQKARAGKIQSRGLAELKKLQNLLDEKGANYMANYSQKRNYEQFDSLRKLTIPSFQNSRLNQSGWRKLD